MAKSEIEILDAAVGEAERHIEKWTPDGSTYFVLAVGPSMNGSSPNANFGTNLSRAALVNTLRQFATAIELKQDNAL